MASLIGVASRAAEDAPAAPPDATALLARAWQNLYAGDFIQVVSLTSRAKSGRSMTRKVQIVRKQNTPPGRALVRFLEPPDIRGTSLLVIERDGRDDDVFVYLPALDRSRRISASQRFDSFFGTNLTYEDLEPKDASRFSAVFARTGAVAGTPCAVLEVRPRAGVESQYERVETCIEPQRAVVFSNDYYVKGRLSKRLEADPASVRDLGGRHLPMRAKVVTLATGFETEVATESHEWRASIPDTLFTAVNLEAGDEQSDRAGAKAEER